MKTINVYKFNELSDAAQYNVYENSNADFSDYYADEYRETLRMFEKTFDIRILDYSVDGYSNSFRYAMINDAPDVEGVRLAKYVWNNYARYITKGKYYSTPGKMVNGRYTYKHRHSKIILEMENCPLTGVCYDCVILQPIIDCLHYKKLFSSYDELIEECLTAFFDEWEKEVNFNNSFEYFKEWASDNDDAWYTENGEPVKVAA